MWTVTTQGTFVVCVLDKWLTLAPTAPRVPETVRKKARAFARKTGLEFRPEDPPCPCGRGGCR